MSLIQNPATEVPQPPDTENGWPAYGPNQVLQFDDYRQYLMQKLNAKFCSGLTRRLGQVNPPNNA